MMNQMGMHMQPVQQPPQGVGPSFGIAQSPMMPSPQQMASPFQQTPNPQQQQQQQAQQQAEKLDNISKVKHLMGPLRESLSQTIKTAAQLVVQNNSTDTGTLKLDSSSSQPRFDKHLEEFYSICDQIELHLKTAKICMQQGTSSQQYLPIPVQPTRLEPTPAENNALSYTQYMDLVKMQISYAKDIHDTLICAAQNISPSD